MSAKVTTEVIDTVSGLIFVWYQFSWRILSMKSTTNEIVILCMIYEGKYK